MNLKIDMDGNPILNQLSEEGFVDLTFQIADITEDNACYRFHVSASDESQEVGFSVILTKAIQGGFDENMNLIKGRVYQHGVLFLRSGEESDRLVAAIGRLYGIRSEVGRMVEEESFTAIALHQGDLDFESECVKLKLFGKDGEPFNEDAYYESFFNVDLANRLVYWNEKDPDYREPLFRALAAEIIA